MHPKSKEGILQYLENDSEFRGKKKELNYLSLTKRMSSTVEDSKLPVKIENRCETEHQKHQSRDHQ